MKRIWGCLRVLGVALALLALGVTLSVRSASAHLVESMRGLGEQIARLHDLSPHSAPRRLILNGLELRVMTASTHLEVKAALDRVQTLCRSVGQLDLPAAVRKQVAERSGENALDSAGALRSETEHEGFLACISLEQAIDGEGLLARLKAFGTSGNLRSLGQFRYALARRKAGITTLVMFWTEGDARLGQVFPRIGDAPGRDLVAVPRPTEVRRVLSAFEEGLPYGFAVYEVTANQSLEAALAHFKGLLALDGWQTHPTEQGSLIAEKAGRRVIVRANRLSTGRVVMSLFDLG